MSWICGARATRFWHHRRPTLLRQRGGVSCTSCRFYGGSPSLNLIAPLSCMAEMRSRERLSAPKAGKIFFSRREDGQKGFVQYVSSSPETCLAEDSAESCFVSMYSIIYRCMSSAHGVVQTPTDSSSRAVDMQHLQLQLPQSASHFGGVFA